MIPSAVTGIFYFKDEIFGIKRQDFLPTFPGYFSFPGGMCKKEESLEEALKREMKEELGIEEAHWKQHNYKISYVGNISTPNFHPTPVCNHFFLIDLNLNLNLKTKYPDFILDTGEIAWGEWNSPEYFLSLFYANSLLMAPPTVALLSLLKKNAPLTTWQSYLVSPYKEDQTPHLYPLKDVLQFLPLSPTFPPANRTNSLFLGKHSSSPPPFSLKTPLDNSILVDPSPLNKEEWFQFKKTLKDLNITPNAILISHQHPDHHRFAEHWAMELQIPLLMTPYTYQRLAPSFSLFSSSLKIILLKEEDLPICACSEKLVKIKFLPGHDEGMIGLYEETLNWFFVSDLVQTVGTVLVGGEEGNMAKYFASLEKIISLNPKNIIPSHGMAVGGVALLEKTLAHRKQREEQIRLLWSQDKTVEEIVSLLYKGIEARLRPFALITVKCHIEKIEQEA